MALTFQCRHHRIGIPGQFRSMQKHHGIGVERTFLLRSPRIDKVQVMRSAKVRRAQLYFLRDRRGVQSVDGPHPRSPWPVKGQAWPYAQLR